MMLKSAGIFPLALVTFLAGACGSTPAAVPASPGVPDASASVKSPAPTAPAAAPRVAPPVPVKRPPVDQSRERWLRYAFTYADHVLVIKVVGWQGGELMAEVVEELRGYKTPKQMPIDGLEWYRGKLVPGSRWIIASYRSRGASPAGGALALLPLTAPNRAKVVAWARPGWRVTPIVAVVRVARAPTPGQPTAGGRVELEVVRVLRGNLPYRRVTDNAWTFAKLHPFVPGGQRYVLSAWSVTPSAHAHVPFVYAHALTLLRPGELPTIVADLRTHPVVTARHQARARASFAELQRAWTFQRAPLVADVTVAMAADEATGCGGHHFTLAPKRWRRGTSATRLAMTLPRIPYPVHPRPGVMSPYLFYGGGHCYHGRERIGERFIAAGWQVGTHAAASVNDTPEMRRHVRAWLTADRPRYAPLPVDPAIFSAPTAPAPRSDGRDNTLFEPRIGTSLLSMADPRQWARLEVVATRSVPLGGGAVYRWIHVRTLSDQRMSPSNSAFKRSLPAHDLMFAGVDLPAWQPGERYWGYWISARTTTRWAGGIVAKPGPFHADKLFLADSFVRDRGFYLDRLLQRARHHSQFTP